MGYYDSEDLPVYDHLATEYCVVDRWFSSVPGATWPNRLYALAGQAAGSRSVPIVSSPMTTSQEMRYTSCVRAASGRAMPSPWRRCSWARCSST